ncbi:P-loop containing nucleoside triphosphate hydrolase protein [Obba rivulosa]|uniref:P-loop containing nucleoside triphosphate hydrolase protein n=1 Tax=Obba rivulosa TaxID=1052685 RepID=A0A8E2AQ71_9APHY|nr:P-loop containing nucleoside triphosphate hydrolase protein [Obba rivulosa]
MCAHVLAELDAHRAHFTEGGGVPPFIVGVQGPQGSGKTFLTSRLRDVLAKHALSVVVLSIDDLYLPHVGLVELAAAHPQNALLKGRGQPGTHDVALGTETLEKLRCINESPNAEVRIPRFDKSLFDGEGDRVEGALVRSPVDVVIFEGWCVGFYPVDEEEILRRWDRPVPRLGEDFFEKRGFRKEDVIEVNERLREYVKWWDMLHAFIQIKPVESHPYSYIYKWRLQQEHAMKASNGGRGMTDAQVEAFVDRYIPGYVFFGDGVSDGYVDANGERKLPPWCGHGLRIQIGENREVVNVEKF